MISFKLFFEQLLLSEAIPLKDVKQRLLSRKYSGAYNNSTLDKLFKNKDRLIYPIELKKVDESTTRDTILSTLGRLGYSVKSLKDYIDGYAYDAKNNKVRIGKILDKEQPELLYFFKTDKIRFAKKEYVVVISRHPYDIAGMSSDRSWQSCMTLSTRCIEYKEPQDEGINAQAIEQDIQQGSIIAYLVPKKEVQPNGKVKLRRPLARILMKPNPATDGNFYYTVGHMYPSESFPDFKNFVNDWVQNNINNDIPKGVKVYRNNKLYDDFGRDIPIGFQFYNGDYFADDIMKKLLIKNNQRYLDNQVYLNSNFSGNILSFNINIQLMFDNNIPSEFIQISKVDQNDRPQHMSFILDKKVYNAIYGAFNLHELGRYDMEIKTLDNNTLDITLEVSMNYTNRFREDTDLFKERMYELLNPIESFNYDTLKANLTKIFEDPSSNLDEYSNSINAIQSKYLELIKSNYLYGETYKDEIPIIEYNIETIQNIIRDPSYFINKYNLNGDDMLSDEEKTTFNSELRKYKSSLFQLNNSFIFQFDSRIRTFTRISKIPNKNMFNQKKKEIIKDWFNNLFGLDIEKYLTEYYNNKYASHSWTPNIIATDNSDLNTSYIKMKDQLEKMNKTIANMIGVDSEDPYKI